MGRIVTSVTVVNPFDPGKEKRCDALVDTGTSFLVLPRKWKEELGEFNESQVLNVETADQRLVEAEVCGPARIQIEGFRAIFNEVAFIDMEPVDGRYEPLVGYIVLEQSQAAVDMVGHRLIPVKYLDLK